MSLQDYFTDDAVYRLNYCKRVLKSLIPINFWLCDSKLNLLSYDEDICYMIYDLFRESQNADQLAEAVASSNKPYIFHQSLGLQWIAMPALKNTKQEGLYLVLGPFQSASVDPEMVAEEIGKRIPECPNVKEGNILSYITFVPTSEVQHLLQSSWYVLNDEPCNPNTICHMSEDAVIPAKADEVEPAGFRPEEEGPDLSGLTATQILLLKYLRNSQSDYGNLLETALLEATAKFSNGASLESAQYAAINYVVLCSRAATEGGLPPTISYSISDHFSNKIWKATSSWDLLDWIRRAYQDFHSRIADYRNNDRISRTIQTCIDFIRMNIYNDPSVHDLAHLTGYTDYYLTRKFKKETGVSVNSFINSEKVARAKILLSTTHTSISEISNMLGYCSRSYFSTIFTKETGHSPLEFRNLSDTSSLKDQGIYEP